MNIKTADYVSCCSDYKKCPEPKLPEYAFIGRSNVGKSSLINSLCNKEGLAKTSSTPGKTQCIVHFLVNQEWYLADLPGYGYARTGRSQRERWQKMTREYMLRRPNLYCAFVLVDLRIPPQAIDMEFMEFLGENGVPLCIVGTKADKISSRQLDESVKSIQARLSETWDPLPPFIITSSKTNKGRDEILDFIEKANHSVAE